MNKFKQTLMKCALTDLGFEGDPLTWRNNSHCSKRYIRERLDQAVANELWREKFSGYLVINGEQRHYDHRPIIMVTDDDAIAKITRAASSSCF